MLLHDTSLLGPAADLMEPLHDTCLLGPAAELSCHKQAHCAVLACISVSVVELKAVHDSLVALYMKQPGEHCFAFFDDVIVPACEKLARSSRHRGKLAGIRMIAPKHCSVAPQLVTSSTMLHTIKAHARLHASNN